MDDRQPICMFYCSLFSVFSSQFAVNIFISICKCFNFQFILKCIDFIFNKTIDRWMLIVQKPHQWNIFPCRLTNENDEPNTQHATHHTYIIRDYHQYAIQIFTFAICWVCCCCCFQSPFSVNVIPNLRNENVSRYWCSIYCQNITAKMVTLFHWDGLNENTVW